MISLLILYVLVGAGTVFLGNPSDNVVNARSERMASGGGFWTLWGIIAIEILLWPVIMWWKHKGRL